MKYLIIYESNGILNVAVHDATNENTAKKAFCEKQGTVSNPRLHAYELDNLPDGWAYWN